MFWLTWYGIVGFNVPVNTISFRRRFYGSHDQTNSVIALKDDWLTCLGCSEVYQ